MLDESLHFQKACADYRSLAVVAELQSITEALGGLLWVLMGTYFGRN
jgi:hypothetical protein